jgi:hypothetical protein
LGQLAFKTARGRDGLICLIEQDVPFGRRVHDQQEPGLLRSVPKAFFVNSSMQQARSCAKGVASPAKALALGVGG